MSNKLTNMEYNKMNLKEFIIEIIKHENIDDILQKCNTQSDMGNVYERTWDIIIKFGFCDIFPNSQYAHLTGNSNNGKLKKLENLNDYLNEKVYSGNSSGCSDITLQNNNDDTFVFISSKYPKTQQDIKKQKSVD